MFMCVVNLKSGNKLDLTWKQSFLIGAMLTNFSLFLILSLALVSLTSTTSEGPIQLGASLAFLPMEVV